MMKPLLILAAAGLLLASCAGGGAGGDAGGESSARDQQLLATTADLIRAWDENNHDLMRANLTSDFVRISNGEVQTRGLEEYFGVMSFFHTAIPDSNIVAEDPFVRGNKTYQKWTVTGTNTGMFGENAPTGRPSVTHGFTILSFNDEGKVTSEEAYFDNLGYQQAWGYTVTPPATP